jgi:hypothetical protein
MRKIRGRPISSLPHTTALIFILCLGILIMPFDRALADVTSEQIAPGGGGRMPQILLSPNAGDEGIVLVANDMGMVFRSEDSGATFTQINFNSSDQLHHLQMRNSDGSDLSFAKPWAWTRPTSSEPTAMIFAGGKYGFYKSSDKGNNWTKIGGFTEGPYYIAFSRRDYTRGIAVVHNNSTNDNTIYVTYDTGDHWYELPTADSPNLPGYVKGVFFDHTAAQPMTFFLATEHNVYKHYYDSDSFHWINFEAGLPTNLSIRHLSGISRSDGTFVAYLTYNRANDTDAAFYKLSNTTGYLWQSMGTTVTTGYPGLPLQPKWPDSILPFYDYIGISESDPNTVYITYEGGLSNAPNWGENDGGDGGIFKTTDGGQTWHEVIFIKSNHKHFNVYNIATGAYSWLSEDNWIWCQKADTVFVLPTNPDIVYASHSGVLKSIDGGNYWNSLAAKNLQDVLPIQLTPPTPSLYDVTGKKATPKGGIPVLAVQDYFIAPGENQRHHFLSNGDFSFFHSTDWGNTWIKESIGISANVYRVATDTPGTPTLGTPGHLWAVGGGVHGLPRLDSLGLLASSTVKAIGASTTDYFATYQPFEPKKPDGSSLNAAIVDIFIDNVDSTGNPRETWYIAALGRDGGVYESTNQGTNWSLVDAHFWTTETEVKTIVNGETVTYWKTVNKNVIRVGRTPDGRLFALTTNGAGFWGSFKADQGLYFLNSGHWTLQKKFNYATNIVFVNQDTYYVSEWSVKDLQGNIYRGGVWEHKTGIDSTDLWTKIFDVFGVSNISLTPLKDKLYLSIMDNSIGVDHYEVIPPDPDNPNIQPSTIQTPYLSPNNMKFIGLTQTVFADAEPS